MPEHTPPLWQQLLGAGAGMLVALALYEGYGFVAPHVQPHLKAPLAFLFPPGTTRDNPPSSEVRMADEEDGKARMERIAARAREIVDRLPSSAPSRTVLPPQPFTLLREEMEMQVERKIAKGKPVEGAGSASSSVRPTIAWTVSSPQASVQKGEFSLASSPAVSATSSRASSARRTVVKETKDTPPAQPHSPRLPGSGVTLWVAMLLTLPSSLLAVPRVRKLLH